MANQGSGEAPGKFEALKEHLLTHKIDQALWTTRAITMVFTFLYFIPIFGSPYNSYTKALVANAATSALRLHQRQPRLSFDTGYLIAIVNEDSFHYLLYSLIFLYVNPTTLALCPIFLFAFLHGTSYSLTLLDIMGQNSWWFARLFISIVEFQSRNILRMIAGSEILLLPFTVILVFTGNAGILTPFMYYHFLVMRYKSHRNPHTYNLFRELRIAFENISNNGSVPLFLRNSIKSLINFICKLAPAEPVRQQ